MDELIIDSHVHLYETAAQARRLKESYVVDEYGEKPSIAYSHRDGTVQDLLESMHENGVTRAIILNLFISSPGGKWRIEDSPASHDGSSIRHDPSSAKRSLIRYNEWLAEIARAHPEFVAFASVDPWVFPGEEAADYVRTLVEERKASGVKLHPNLHGIRPADPSLHPLFRACEELRIPVVSHCGPAHGGMGGATPSAFFEVLQAFPRLTLVLAHLGGAAWREAAAIAGSFGNVYFDCAEILAWVGASKGPSEKEMASLILEIGPDRVLLGSDFPWYEPSTHVSLLMELPLLTDADRCSILGANAARVLLADS